MRTPAKLLIDAGLLQFGRFETANGWRPFLLNLAYLPSYPSVMSELVSAAVARVPDAEYLLATADAVPFAVALGLALQRPLVYSRGSAEPPVTDLVGAYDIGHSAALIAGTLDDGERLAQLASGARRVGLDARAGIAIVDLGIAPVANMEMRALFMLPDAVDELVASGDLPSRQARAVHDWIAARRHARSFA